MMRPMNFCCDCGHRLEYKVPEADLRPRYCCLHCQAIHYQNPKIVVGTLPVWGDQVLLCKRAIEPRHGFWTLPAGFMENGETLGQGAVRETVEEACAEVRLQEMFSVLDVEAVHQVHIYYRAQLVNLNFRAGPESLEVALFHEQEIPWEQLAFRSVELTLKAFFSDRRAGHWQLHTGSIKI